MILFVNDLTVIDFSYLCNRRGPVGESWIVDVVLHGDLNSESMVLDFALVKKQIKRLIDESIDHKLAIPTGINGKYELAGDRVNVDYQFDTHHFAMSAPKSSVCFVTGENVDVANTINFLKSVILPELPKNVKDVEFLLRPEASRSFYYHYSHGLKKHDGNCQRIVHGHRSQIEIFLDNIPTPRLQKELADKWQDIYLGSEEDIIDANKLTYIEAKSEDICFAYEASQGYFELAIANARCDILPCDTTVECIAHYLAHELKKQHSTKQVKVKAYEGVGKGAIAIA
ncbi:NADPH dependent preQ0 reductase [Pseudoalteromonas luteoviolacea B = ATCC 29581]|nr:NADPH dependent preQ0 reductase [Pseudoalteromonas luteoviolacea B = ATCC 29581]